MSSSTDKVIPYVIVRDLELDEEWHQSFRGVPTSHKTTVLYACPTLAIAYRELKSLVRSVVREAQEKGINIVADDEVWGNDTMEELEVFLWEDKPGRYYIQSHIRMIES